MDLQFLGAQKKLTFENKTKKIKWSKFVTVVLVGYLSFGCILLSMKNKSQKIYIMLLLLLFLQVWNCSLNCCITEKWIFNLKYVRYVRKNELFSCITEKNEQFFQFTYMTWYIRKNEYFLVSKKMNTFSNLTIWPDISEKMNTFLYHRKKLTFLNLNSVEWCKKNFIFQMNMCQFPYTMWLQKNRKF